MLSALADRVSYIPVTFEHGDFEIGWTLLEKESNGWTFDSTLNSIEQPNEVEGWACQLLTPMISTSVSMGIFFTPRKEGKKLHLLIDLHPTYDFQSIDVEHNPFHSSTARHRHVWFGALFSDRSRWRHVSVRPLPRASLWWPTSADLAWLTKSRWRRTADSALALSTV